MENATKALVIAGNVLLAVLILSLVMYFYNTWRRLPLEEEAALLVKQAQEFNQQYEVFDKKLMYGVDVLSCVNKAISNNEKYVTGSWLSGALSPKEFVIEVEVVIDEPLTEELEVYYMATSHFDAYTNTTIHNTSSHEEKDFSRDNSAYTFATLKTLFGDQGKTRPKFELPPDDYLELYDYTDNTNVASGRVNITNWGSIKLDTQVMTMKATISPYEKKVDSTKASDSGNYLYTLLDGKYDKNIIDEDVMYLKRLIKTISTFTTSDSQIIYNKSSDSNTHKEWTKIEWTPAVSTFKNRKFRCEGINSNGQPDGSPGIHYNEETGAIDKLTFVESSIKSVD